MAPLLLYKRGHLALVIIFIFLSQRCLCSLYQSGKAFSVVNSHLREHLSVDFDAGLLETVHELAVGDAVHSRCCVDSCDPESSEISLLILSADICRSEGSHNSRVSSSENLALLSVESLG